MRHAFASTWRGRTEDWSATAGYFDVDETGHPECMSANLVRKMRSWCMNTVALTAWLSGFLGKMRIVIRKVRTRKTRGVGHG
jgi:hypothetical protein